MDGWKEGRREGGTGPLAAFCPLCASLRARAHLIRRVHVCTLGYEHLDDLCAANAKDGFMQRRMPTLPRRWRESSMRAARHGR